ncbi:hypothetical protein ACFWQ9_31165, partial [Streptomyces albidoflavus]
MQDDQVRVAGAQFLVGEGAGEGGAGAEVLDGDVGAGEEAVGGRRAPRRGVVGGVGAVFAGGGEVISFSYKQK